MRIKNEEEEPLIGKICTSQLDVEWSKVVFQQMYH